VISGFRVAFGGAQELFASSPTSRSSARSSARPPGGAFGGRKRSWTRSPRSARSTRRGPSREPARRRGGDRGASPSSPQGGLQGAEREGGLPRRWDGEAFAASGVPTWKTRRLDGDDLLPEGAGHRLRLGEAERHETVRELFPRMLSRGLHRAVPVRGGVRLPRALEAGPRPDDCAARPSWRPCDGFPLTRSRICDKYPGVCPHDRPTGRKAFFRELGKYSALGLEMALSVVIGMGIGYYLDRWLGTTPWLMIVWIVWVRRRGAQPLPRRRPVREGPGAGRGAAEEARWAVTPRTGCRCGH